MYKISAVNGSSSSRKAPINISGITKKKKIAITAANEESPIATLAVRFTATQSLRAKALPTRTVPA